MSSYDIRYFENDIAVFWDIVDCKIPNGSNARDVAGNIQSALRDSGYRGAVKIMAYGDTTQIEHDFNSAGITLIHVPAAGEKYARARKIVTDMFIWVLDHRFERSNLMPVMGDMSQDNEFIKTLYLMIRKNFNILLSQPESASGQLLSAPSCVWSWTSLASGGSPVPKDELEKRWKVVYQDGDSEESESEGY